MVKRKVLYLTSYTINQFGGAAKTHIEFLEKNNCDVDLLTLYSFKGQKSNHYSILEQPFNTKIQGLRSKISSISILRNIYYMFFKNSNKPNRPDYKYLIYNDIVIILEKENNPIISNEVVLSKISKEYDYFIFFGWQDMMSSATLEAIFDIYKKPIIVYAPDMYPFTGNCFYSGSCDNYLNECRNCPVFAKRPNNNQAHENFLFKKRVYKKTGCFFTVNTHQKKFILKTGILDEEQIFLTSHMLDTNIFKPLSTNLCRKRFKIRDCYSFVMLVRYVNFNSSESIRKGLPIFKQALKLLYNRLADEQRSKCLIAFVGTTYLDSDFSCFFDAICIGNLNTEDLIKAYNASSIFVCPSIDDAGPSMVNQSMACGTPVVAFNQGAALDLLENGISGYKAELGDLDEFVNCIERMLNLSEEEYSKMRETTRLMSLKENSFEAGLKQTERQFQYIEKMGYSTNL